MPATATDEPAGDRRAVVAAGRCMEEPGSACATILGAELERQRGTRCSGSLSESETSGGRYSGWRRFAGWGKSVTLPWSSSEPPESSVEALSIRIHKLDACPACCARDTPRLLTDTSRARCEPDLGRDLAEQSDSRLSLRDLAVPGSDRRLSARGLCLARTLLSSPRMAVLATLSSSPLPSAESPSQHAAANSKVSVHRWLISPSSSMK